MGTNIVLSTTLEVEKKKLRKRTFKDVLRLRKYLIHSGLQKCLKNCRALLLEFHASSEPLHRAGSLWYFRFEKSL